MKTITLLGATGTIGDNTLKIIAEHRDNFSLQTVTAGENVQRLAEIAKRFKVKRAVIGNEKHYATLKELLAGSGIEVGSGDDALEAVATEKVSIVVSAIVGAAALKPTLAALKAGNRVALANKECLVCAGALVNQTVRDYGGTIIPIDSEHSGLFQIFDDTQSDYIERVTLTASGGPFRTFSLEEMKRVTPKQAIKHPNWTMGAKISVDSATLMNKGLELIEAYYLFPIKPHELDVIIHPQSIIHALVHMIDGSVIAQMSMPDMCTPIAYALGWPERITNPSEKLDLAKTGTLQFEAPDYERFPALGLAKQALIAGGTAPTILNAANEIAVGRFLRSEIGFLDIARIVYNALEKCEDATMNNLQDVLAVDHNARMFAEAA